MADKNDLSTKQKRALAFLLTERTTEQAAKAAGISERQLYRWLEMPAFQDALKRAEATLIDAATRRLVTGIDEALNTLHGLMTSAESEAVRRAAAAEWLAQLLKIREYSDLENRLQKVEEALNL